MANEIVTSVTHTANKGGAAVTMPSASKTFDMAGTNMFAGTQTITDTEEALAFGDVTAALSTVSIKNLNTVDYVDVSTGTGVTFAAHAFRIYPGRTSLFTPVAGTLNLQCDTGKTVEVFKTITEA